MLLTRGRTRAYATQHSPWTPVERACTPYATCSRGKGVCGAMLDASGCGRAVTVFVARQVSGPAGILQRCPGVHAVDGGTSGRDGGVWSEGCGDSARRPRGVKARTRRSGGAKGRPQLCATAAPAGCGVLVDVACTYGHGGLLCSMSVLLGAVCPSAHDAGRLPFVCTASPLGHVLPGYWLSFVPLLWYTGARMACPIPIPSAARRLGVGRVGDDL